MHQAQSYIQRFVLPSAPGLAPSVLALTASFAAGMQQTLKADAVGYCYSGTVSIADGIRGIDSGFFTWATIKLYYATFYLARALLAVRGACIFYDGRTPFRWLSNAGQVAKKLKGNTHHVVLDEFKALGFFPLFLGQQIDNLEPLDWLRIRRETANYASPRFTEPDPPDHLERISSMGVRRVAEAYLSDKTRLYVFDSDHAMLAYPIELLKQTIQEINGLVGSQSLNHADRTFLAAICKDAAGPLPGVRRLLLS